MLVRWREWVGIPYLLCCLVWLWTCHIAVGNPVYPPYLTRETFHFTRAAYNASIMENSIGKTYVSVEEKMGVPTILEGPQIDIQYEIIGGDDNELFKAEDYVVGDFCFLRIRTHTGIYGEFNRELRDSYTLQVKAVGKYEESLSLRLEATTEVKIKVEDANDLSPLFYPQHYTVTVDENAALHSSVVQVTASDADVGVNGEIYYSFAQKTRMFAIHPTSGIVYVTRPLNYAKQKVYKFDVLAVDRGPKTESSQVLQKAKATLTITVAQVNFYQPEIAVKNLPSVVEHGMASVYAILTVHDADEGDNGLINKVDIIAGNRDGLFKVSNSSTDGEYMIEVQAELDREVMPWGYNLTILAEDRGKPNKSTMTAVHVKILDTNDNAPKFTKEKYEIQLEETVPCNTPLIFVNAGDKDLGKNAEILYSIQSGNARDLFKIHPWKGLLSTNGELDAESQDKFELTISALDQGNTGSRKQGTAKVIIKVIDCNDNSPMFNVTSNVVYVDENKPMGTEVFMVSAYDLDRGENSYLSYSIANLNPVPFEINHFTGLVKTTEVLDFESMRKTYKIKVRASDWGAPFRRESEQVFTIGVRDVNDNTPKFESVNCTGYVAREAPMDTELLVVSAIDHDFNNIVSYQIVDGNQDGCFELNSSTGKLSLTCTLVDFPSNRLILIIKATDGTSFSDPMVVNITLVNTHGNVNLANNNANIHCKETGVTEETSKLLQESKRNNDETKDVDLMSIIPSKYLNNEHSPVFANDIRHSLAVSEGMPVGATVLQLKVSDEDPSYNGMLVFSVSAGDEGYFKVDTKTGAISVLSQLDRETTESLNLTVNVTDLGEPRLSSTTFLAITIIDENDCHPKFEEDFYSASVSEDVRVGAFVVQVIASDQDKDENSEVTYSILSDTDDFHIDAWSGIITVNLPLNREMQEVYYLIVQAQDAGERPLSSTTTVTVTVDDINDNRPYFVPSTYTIKIREDLPVGTVVMTITAEDPDIGAGGTVRYLLLEGFDEKFSIDEDTGVIRITEPLNFEQKQVFNITAFAQDGGLPLLTSECKINIEVVDVNENLYPPVFKNFVAQGSVKENEPINSPVMQVAAKDPDISGYRPDLLIYSIRGGSGLGRFTIDNEGTIRTNQVLDRETESHYWLTVYAQDRGVVPLYSRLDVYIEVEDINDNIPQTIQPAYYTSVKENTKAGVTVIKLEAEDLDENPLQRLQFDITGGNPQGFFRIDPVSGAVLTTKRKLDRERQSEHILEVTISDNGHPNLSSTSRVVVQVDDDNDNGPQFTERLYRVRILEPPQGVSTVSLLQVVAFDKDSGANAEITYSARGSRNKFHVHPKTGEITSLSPKDLIKGSDHSIHIKAEDGGVPPKKSIARVRVSILGRPTMSEHPPHFSQKVMNVTVMEDDKLGRALAFLQAEDGDLDKLWYNITAGNEDHKFVIGSEDGTVFLAQSLDWETRSSYILTISVTDGVDMDYCTLYIEVQDTNDNAPEFTQTMYVGQVSESSEVGTSILEVTASDLDKEKKLLYTIYGAANHISMELFQINSLTGLVSVKKPLDHEALNKHQLVIMARDQGVEPYRSFAKVIVNVLDSNDHKPEFLSTRFEGRVFETAAIGTSVVQVLAIDRDKGRNAEIKYSIVSGNVGNAFSIDEKLGMITVSEELDRNEQSSYLLVVKSEDQGNPSLSSTARVKIFVTISNNAPPKFRYTEYTSELQENSSPGETILTVNAESCSSVVYEIISGDDNRTFSINPNSGVLSSQLSFDYEQNQFFNLTVLGTNMVGATASTNVLIHIVDVNDNSPVFKQAVYSGNVTECTAAGTVVLDEDLKPLVIKATDKDLGRNGLMVYEIINQEAQQYFSIDSSTGAIRTGSLLNHEEFSVYEFTVSVTDTGEPALTAKQPARVVIYISDINDSPPEFDAPGYNATVLLPTYKDVCVLTVEATDPDSEVDSELVYSIIDGNRDGKFNIDETTGSIFVIDEHEMLDFYSLTVQVSDGEFTGQTNVGITVEKTENSGLQFTDTELHLSVMENYTVVETLAAIQIVGHAINEHLQFKILNPNEHFKLGATSGVLQTTGLPFDRETQDSYYLVVEVRDTRPIPRLSHLVVYISVTDKNDNAPMFVNQPYYSILSVDSKRGDTVIQVSAIDKDLGRNGEVMFRLVDGAGGRFTVHRSTGEIYLSDVLLEVEENTEFILIVEASDRGTPPLTAQTEVPVKVITKATPVFEHQYYNVSIPENIQLHSPVVSLQAGSPNGQKLIYSITKGDKYGEFAVDFNTGVLYVVDSLDNEGSINSYELTLRATDTMTGSYSETLVSVQLEDINDNPPMFQSQSYTAIISEAVRAGSEVLVVAAVDKDIGMNRLIRYSLVDLNTDHNDTLYFQVGAETGELTTRLLLDHEKRSDYQFYVVATDSGMPALSSSAITRVKISDLNDNFPVFDQPSYNCIITEQLDRGQFVTKVTASDPDTSDVGQLRYSIVSGNDQQAFIVDRKSGVIRLSDQRTPNLRHSYSLNISVTDQVFTNYARVQIQVKSLNNYSPKFSESIYHGEFSENIGEGMLVTTVSAVDQDIGTNSALSYGIVSELAQKLFRIDADTGELFSRMIFDREMQAQYEVPVTVTDNGGFMAFSTVIVSITDMNDNVPQFLVQEYKSNIYHDASINSTVLQVRATDADTGDNGDIVFSMFNSEGSQASEMFDVDPFTGVISVKNSLQNSVNQVYQFFVHAKDQGSPSLENNVPVEILVMGPMDHPPAFDQPGFSFFIPENTEINTVIATIAANVNDTIYSIVQGFTRESNNPPKFTISQEGKIKVLSELDRETSNSFTLTIRAETPTTPPLVAHTTVHVQVMDINDNKPKFESNPYLATVPENTEPGIKVIQVKALDNDTGVNAEVKYAFTAEVGTLANMFAIDSQTGEITLLVPLNREEADEYNLTVIVTDTGSSEGLSDTTLVTVRVMDYNDEPPVFTQSTYSGAVNEDALPGTVIVSISTSDPDIPPNTDVTYYITRGDPLGQFAISKLGEVYVNTELDRESKTRYKMDITATDGGFVTRASVVIDILDANDNSPDCDLPLYQKFVREDVNLNHYITPIVATDSDEQGTRNARIHYSLEGEGADNFVIGAKTGYLTTAVELDREVQSEYQLVVRAVDGGGLSCTTEVYITVKDVNDNPPQFTMETYTVTVAESSRVNTLITRVSASDIDLGINRKVKYHLKEASDAFALDEVSGIISLTRVLDREVNPQFTLTVQAFDQGNPSLSSETSVVVVVLDINDNPPEFELTSYSASVKENVLIGSPAVTVLATSRDVGINAVITYSIVAGNELGKFSVDPETGVIRVYRLLDHELSREFFLTVQASDGGTPSLSNTAVVNINVTDVNDMSPRFSQPLYVGEIREDAKIGDTVAQVMATDEDSPPFDQITYSIEDGDPDHHFIINSKTGYITVAFGLDREQTSDYHLKIKASDGELSSSVQVSVNVKDANDCPPVFQQKNYTKFVQSAELTAEEDRTDGFNLLKLVVDDCDLEPNAGPFVFNIISGNEGKEFRVDSSGDLLIAGVFKKQVKDTYNLTIRVFDSGLPTLYSDTFVLVHIIEESSYPPKVDSLTVSISSYLDEFPGGLIGNITATDEDIYDRLSFSIVSPNKHLFNIDEDDGRIIALPGLDSGDYVINISVTDGKYYTTALVTVEVKSISQEMVDNSVTVQLESLTPEVFLKKYLKSFKKTLKAELSVRAKDIEIISVQPASDQDSNIFSRHRRAVPNYNLDILFAVRKTPNSYYRSNSLRRKVSAGIPSLERSMGVPVVKVYNDICERDFCDHGECTSYVDFNKENVARVVVDGETFVTAKHHYARKCQCQDGYGGEKCSEQVTTCIHNPCPKFMACRPHPAQGYQCVCPEGRTGPHCDEVVNTTPGRCTDAHCQRGDKPMAFSGRSYAKWRLVDKIEKRLSLDVKIKTRKATASVMYATGESDYSILELVNGMVQFKFNLGSGEGTVLIPVIISDGNWHQVIVERNGNYAEVMLDGKFSGQAMAPGTNEILNLASHDVYFGAEVGDMSNGYKNIQNGFEGCLDDVKVNGIRLPAAGSNAVATSQDFEDVEFHCLDSTNNPQDTSGACGRFPCLNGGMCISLSAQSFRCECSERYGGQKCEIDNNPCASQPCMYGGTCSNIPDVPNDFQCQCKVGLSGKRCNYGHFCNADVCLNQGVCIEGPKAPICRCDTNKVSGERCEILVDPCHSSPCQHGSVCQPNGQTYTCNCTSGTAGIHCDEVTLPAITPGLKNEEIYGIIGCVVGILLIVIIFVSCRLYRRRRKRNHGNVTGGIADAGEVLLNSIHDDFKRTKLSNLDIAIQNKPPSPRPPPVPNRPASYTPSNHDSVNTLNNFDNVRNYGSAADELESIHNIPMYSDYLQTFTGPRTTTASIPPSLPPPPPSNSGSDSESIQKGHWEFDYPNILQKYGEDKKYPDNLGKLMPHISHQNLQGAASLSSLPVSESEDDLPGYHWDTSDWAPHPSLPNISEVPMKEVPDSLSSSPHSHDSNTHVGNHEEPDQMARIHERSHLLYHDDSEYVENDSEYVGDSEYADNEFDDDYNDDPSKYPSSVDFQQILALQAQLQEADQYELPRHNLNVHLNQYLPNYNLNGQQSEQENEEEEEEDANHQQPLLGAGAAGADDDIIHYGFPRPSRFVVDEYGIHSDYNGDGDQSQSALDNMSVSMGGYTSTNASCSDISGLCEIEDSEINLSDEDSPDSNYSAHLKVDNLHTQV